MRARASEACEEARKAKMEASEAHEKAQRWYTLCEIAREEARCCCSESGMFWTECV